MTRRKRPDGRGSILVVKLVRTIRRGDDGPDVLALKRALKKAGYGRGLVLAGKPGRRFGPVCDRQLRVYQRRHFLQADGVFGQKTLDMMEMQGHVDQRGRELFAEAPKPDPAREKYAKLLSYMHLMTVETPGYLWGAGHGPPLDQVRIDGKLDCSSSVSKALHQVGLFPHDVAWVSGEFERYGDSGTGRLFSVYANSEHVWIRLYEGRWWRFDTSPHGDGGRGPQLRKMPRFTFGFVARHWPGY